MLAGKLANPLLLLGNNHRKAVFADWRGQKATGPRFRREARMPPKGPEIAALPDSSSSLIIGEASVQKKTLIVCSALLTSTLIAGAAETQFPIHEMLVPGPEFDDFGSQQI